MKQSMPNKAKSSDQMASVKLDCINIDLLVTDVEVFYNRQLVQNFQGFMNQAAINKVQNAQAEADFDARVEKLKIEQQ